MRGKKAIINIISSLLLQAITIVCGLIVPRLIIGTFGSETNGLITSITQFLAYITLLESGIGPVIKAVLYKPIAQKNKETIEKILKTSEKFFRRISYIFIIYVIILCIAFPIIMREQFDAVYTVSLVLIISIGTFAEYFFGMTYRLYLQAEQKTYVVSVIQMIGYVLNTILVIVLVKVGSNIQVVKLASAAVFILRPVLQNWYVKRKYNINLKGIKDDYKLDQKWDGLAQHIASVIHNNTDVAILTLLATAKDVSVYAVYNLVVNGIRQLIQSFSNGIDATFGDMIAKDETDHLQKSFKIYEFFFNTIITIAFTCTFILIIPFVKVYTHGITDYNYILPAFAFIIVSAEFMWAIRQPYNALIKGKGHFRETRVGAWIEVAINITLSLLLVKPLGMVGVAIGTVAAMTYRTIEYMYHASKYILKRKSFIAFVKMGIAILEIAFVIFITYLLPQFNGLTYMSWFIYAIKVAAITGVVVLLVNSIIYKKERKNAINIIKNKIKNRRKK